MAPLQLFGVCLTALGQMRAKIERSDAERGVVVAAVGEGPLAPVSELALALTPLGEGQTTLVATWRARKHGGDRRLLAALLASVDRLVAVA
jgi:hypothetical protein